MDLFLSWFWARNVLVYVSQESSAMKIACSSMRTTGSCMPFCVAKIADCVSRREQGTSRVRCPATTPKAWCEGSKKSIS